MVRSGWQYFSVGGPVELGSCRCCGSRNKETRSSKATEVREERQEMYRETAREVLSGQVRDAGVLVRHFRGRTGRKTGRNSRRTDPVAKPGAWDGAAGRDRTGACLGGQGWTPVIR